MYVPVSENSIQRWQLLSQASEETCVDGGYAISSLSRQGRVDITTNVLGIYTRRRVQPSSTAAVELDIWAC